MEDLNGLENIDESYRFLQEEKINDKLKCTICMNVLQDPRVHSGCGNMFCSQCIASLKICPLCRGSMTKSTLHVVSLFVREEINQLKVVCRYCSEVTTKESIEKHFSQCQPRLEGKSDLQRALQRRKAIEKDLEAKEKQLSILDDLVQERQTKINKQKRNQLVWQKRIVWMILIAIGFSNFILGRPELGWFFLTVGATLVLMITCCC